MWTLDDADTRLRDRLAEESTVFWSLSQRREYLSDAQDFIAAVTRGVEHEVVATVSSSNPVIPLPTRVVNAHPAAAFTGQGRALNVVPIATANLVDVEWRSRKGRTPQWVIPHFSKKEAYVTPIPTQPVQVGLVVSVLPDRLEEGSDVMFNGSEVMSKYLNSTLNLAASYALLKERYDGDAERFYQLAITELTQLGIVPEDIPPFKQVMDERREAN